MNHQHEELLEHVYASMLVERKRKQESPETYSVMTNKGPKTCRCKHAARGCDCDGCEDCRSNQQMDESKKQLTPAQKKIAQAAPPPDEITGADFKALAKKKKQKLEEFSDFKSYFADSINEGTRSSRAQKVGASKRDLGPGAQFECAFEFEGKKHVKTLSRESVNMMRKNPEFRPSNLLIKSEASLFEISRF
jgi:hypothetical protein